MADIFRGQGSAIARSLLYCLQLLLMRSCEPCGEGATLRAAGADY